MKVSDTVEALGKLACEYRRRAGFKVIAITGSVGKTTTRQIAHHVLSTRYHVRQSPRNFNNQIGLPLSLLAAEPDDEILIVELGANRPGEIAYLSKIAAPDVAVVTNVYPAHLAGFGDIETITAEKLSICEGLRQGGVLHINVDCRHLVDEAKRRQIPFAGFGKSGSADYRSEQLGSDGFTSWLTIEGTEVHLPLAGKGNAENALAAWAVCSRFGITTAEFAEAAKTLHDIPMRMEVLQMKTVTVLNDSYNANPASMRNALDTLAKLAASANKRAVFICGDMAELDRQAEHLHRQLGQDIAGSNVHVLLVVGRLAAIAASAAKEDAKYDMQIECFEQTSLLCENLHHFVKDGDVILVKGSRVNKLESAVEKLKELFAPAKIVEKTDGGRGTQVAISESQDVK